MQKSMAVWENTGNSSALPHPNTSYSSGGETYTVEEVDMENWTLQYKKAYQGYLVKNGTRRDDLADAQRLEILRGAHDAGHNAAKKWHKKLHGIK